MKKALILLGGRQINKRAALFYECMVSDEWKCTIFSLPRGPWNLSALDTSESSWEPKVFTLKDKATEMEGIPDVVICCHWSLMPVALLLKVLFGSKVIYEECDYHEIMLKTFGTWFQRNISVIAVKAVKASLLRFFDLTLCIHLKNSIHMDQLKRFNPNVMEFHNYPSMKWAGNTRKHPDGNAAIAFVYLGEMSEGKGCKLAAQAFLASARCSSAFKAEMHFFGRRGDENLVKWLSAQRDVFVHMRESPARIRAFLAERQCVGLLMYENNGYYAHVGTNSQKMYEYLAAGVPIIASRVGELEEMITKDGLGYLVDVDVQIEPLSKLFMSIVADRKQLAEQAIRAASFISENRMWCESEWQKVVATGVFETNSTQLSRLRNARKS